MKRWLVLVGLVIFVAGAWAAAADTGQKTGTVKIDPGLILKIKAGKSKFTGKPEEVALPPGREISLPAGNYPVIGAQLCKQDPRTSEVWTLTATTLGKLASFDVTEGQTTTVTGGAPLAMKTSLVRSVTAAPAGVCNAPLRTSTAAPKATAPKGPPQKVVTVLLSYVGQAGEVYSAKALKGRSLAAPPGVRLVDEQGKVLTEGPYKFPSTGGG